ncbi:MAG: acyltransferase [Pseudomonadota bacterium]|nr:acyltransferase [Pseudomonadota bacterium]
MAFLVMCAHFGVFPGFEHAGNFGVQVFFSLSGWLIGGILLKTSAPALPRFYFNRAIRIWTPYYLALLFIVAGGLLHDKNIGAKWIEFVIYKTTFVWNLFGTQQLATAQDLMPLKGTGNHFWSVNAEEQFYLMAPAMLVLLPGFGRKPVVWGVLAAWACITGNIYAAVILGVFLATLQARSPGFHEGAAARAVALVILLVAAVVIVTGTLYPNIAPIAGAMIVLLLAREGPKSPVAGFFGGLSYQLYLNHWVGGFIVQVAFLTLGYSKTSPWATLISLGVSVGIAAALYWTIDRPLLAKRSRFFTPARGRLAMSAGYAILALGIAFGLAVNLRT